MTDLCRDGVGCLSIIPKDIVTQRGKCTVVFFLKSAAKSVMMPVCIFDVVTPPTGATATEMVLDRELFKSRILDRLSALLKTTPGPALLLENFFAARYSNREMLPAYKGFTARVVAGTGLVLLGSWHDVLCMLGGGAAAAADETEEIMSFFAPAMQVRDAHSIAPRAVQVSYVTVETAGAGDEDEMRLFQRVRRVARTLAPAHVVVDGQAAGDHKYEFVFHGDTFSEMRIIREAWRLASRGRDVPFSLNYGTRICKSPAWDARGLMPGTNGSTRPGRMGRLSAAGSTLARVALSAMQLGDCRRLPLSGCLASIGIARATPHDMRKKSPPVRSLEEYRLAPIMSMDEAATHLQAEGVLTSDFFAGAGGELYAKKLDEQKRRIDALKKRFAQGMASSAAVAPLQMRIQSQSEKIKTQDEELVKSRRANKRLRDEQARMQEEKQKAEARARAIENDFMQELQGLSQQVEADEAIRREAERVVRTADAGERPDKRAKATVS